MRASCLFYAHCPLASSRPTQAFRTNLACGGLSFFFFWPSTMESHFLNPPICKVCRICWEGGRGILASDRNLEKDIGICMF